MTSQDGNPKRPQEGLKKFSTESNIIQDDDVFDPDGSVPISMPERSAELNKIHRVLAPVARGSSPKNRLIFGKPGQGKTAAVKLKRQQMESELSDRDDVNISFLYVSCKENPSSYDVAQSLLQKLKDVDSKPKGYQLSELYDLIYQEMEKIGGAFLIILDEVDAIKPHKSKYDEPNEPNILYKFPRSRSSESLSRDTSVGIIGISNDREFKRDLTPRCMDALGDTSIDFKPYDKEQLFQILQRRAERGLKNTSLEEIETDDGTDLKLQSEVIDEKQLRKCAELAADERGSARQALRYLGSAASIADAQKSDRIEDDHIDQAENEVRQQYVHDVLTDHTMDDWLVFIGVLWSFANGKDPIKTSDVHKNYRTVCNALDIRPKVQRRMTERLKDLDLTGAINLEKQTGGQKGGEYFKVELTLPFNEALNVMGTKEPFTDDFSEIIDEIRYHSDKNLTQW